jgi:signal transduction histidine kinase
MQATYQFAVIAFLCTLLLGLAVFAVNMRRPTNRSFFLLTITISTWLFAVMAGLFSQTSARAAFWIRFCSMAGAFLPPTFHLLRLSIIYHRETWSQHFGRGAGWFTGAIVVGLFCWSPFFLKGVLMVSVPGQLDVMQPDPEYTKAGWALFCLYLSGAFLSLAYLLIRDQFDSHIIGTQRAELQFLLLAYLLVVVTILVTNLINGFLGGHKMLRYAPLRFVGFALIIAYGISSRGILNVRSALRIALSYLLLGTFAGIIFYFSWLVFGAANRSLGVESEFWHALCAAITSALLITAAGTPLRRITKTILPPADVDFEKIVGQVAHIVQSVATLPELLTRFSAVLCKAMGTPSVKVLLDNGNGYAEPGGWDQVRRLSLFRQDLVVEMLISTREELAVEELHRRAPGPERDALLVRMESLDADLILPIRYRDQITGLLVLASRTSGRIYGRDGRAILRVIAEQLGVAIANSQLYTEARQSQAYNQFLVEHLPCGVIATDPQGTLTVVNPEARLLLQLDESSSPSEIELPKDISRLIPPTLVGDTIARDEEIILRPTARDQAHLLVSCLPFASERNDLLGAVLVINDHTAIERLQNQVRQADRLASIGTLASGMAHEIKNPLTALKTFTQLLPKRYNDAEFRQDFSSLVGSEIARIERIVNELLAFARPAPLMIERVNMHEIADAAVRLVGPQASRLNVQVRGNLVAAQDWIAADKDRLQQVLLNLLLNALQASRPGDCVELSTELMDSETLVEQFIRIDVRDTGCGIAKETLPHIFDPFFTTKSEGTGLGLSVSYNIIAEHGGRLEVQSEVGKGTCFSIYLPLTTTARYETGQPPGDRFSAPRRPGAMPDDLQLVTHSSEQLR